MSTTRVTINGVSSYVRRYGFWFYKCRIFKVNAEPGDFCFNYVLYDEDNDPHIFQKIYDCKLKNAYEQIRELILESIPKEHQGSSCKLVK